MIYPRKNFTSTWGWLQSCFWNSLPSFLFRSPWLTLFDGGCWQDICEDLFCYDEPRRVNGWIRQPRISFGLWHKKGVGYRLTKDLPKK